MRAWGKFVCHSNKKLKPWRDHICNCLAGKLPEPLHGSIYAYLIFVLPRPKTSKRDRPCIRPDLDKLVRAVLDAVTQSKAIEDDGQIVEIQANKLYGDKPMLKLYLKELT